MADSRRRIPAYDHDLPVFTYEDAVESVLDAFNLEGRHDRISTVRRSVLDAYRDLPNARKWRSMLRRGQVTTIAPVSTGTLDFDLTGGTPERLVTFSGAPTLPADVWLYGLLIADQPYKIEDRKSDTELTLTADSNPGEDLSGVEYTLYRSVYPLPTNFRRGSALVELDTSWWPRYVGPDELLHAYVDTVQPQEPDRYTIRGAGEYYGGLAVEFQPPPSHARSYDYLYEARPRPLRYDGYCVGTVSASGTTVTGSGTSFTDKMVGSIIRFPVSANDTPTGLAGDNPYDEERSIMSVASPTSLTIDETVGTVSSTNYTISDPIDIEADSMLTAFKRLCEVYYARFTGKEDRHERMSIYMKSLRLAAEADTRYSSAGNPYVGAHDPTITITTEA